MLTLPQTYFSITNKCRPAQCESQTHTNTNTHTSPVNVYVRVFCWLTGCLQAKNATPTAHITNCTRSWRLAAAQRDVRRTNQQPSLLAFAQARVHINLGEHCKANRILRHQRFVGVASLFCFSTHLFHVRRMYALYIYIYNTCVKLAYAN